MYNTRSNRPKFLIGDYFLSFFTLDKVANPWTLLTSYSTSFMPCEAARCWSTWKLRATGTSRWPTGRANRVPCTRSCSAGGKTRRRLLDTIANSPIRFETIFANSCQINWLKRNALEARVQHTFFSLTWEILRPVRCAWTRGIFSATASTRDSRSRGSRASSRSDRAAQAAPSSWNGETRTPSAWATWGCAPVGVRLEIGNFVLNIILQSLPVKRNVMISLDVPGGFEIGIDAEISCS